MKHYIVILFILLSCPTTEIINKTNEKWITVDQNAYDRAKYVCANDSRYKDVPCLKVFIKKDIRTYHAICGYQNINKR